MFWSLFSRNAGTVSVVEQAEDIPVPKSSNHEHLNKPFVGGIAPVSVGSKTQSLRVCPQFRGEEAYSTGKAKDVTGTGEQAPFRIHHQ
jgi:hypothetical protein